ncbi:MAG: hypothetical protein JO257_34165 [Deltaproteobacteria bacterium]|nr:hypothetical protein [Deltaproteobacteria bacterium]
MIDRVPADRVPADRAAAPAPARPRPDGVFFGGAARPRFGWLHRPAAADTRVAGGMVPTGLATDTALVIVPPFGYEAICAHRSLRALAEAAAERGLLGVRFDLDGTGDSAGDDLDPARVEAWLASIGDACDLARANGASRIVLAGVRLGALLACLAAARRASSASGASDIVGVIAIAPVTNGKAFVREGRALQMQLGLAPAPPGLASAPPALAPAPSGLASHATAASAADDIHELVGFALTAETRAALSAIDLAKLPPPTSAMLVIDRDDLAPNDKWVAALRAGGCAVEHVRLPGYVEMVLDPHKVIVPRTIIEAAVAFAAREASAPATGASAAATGASAAPEGGRPAAANAGDSKAVIGGVSEEAVWIDDQLAAIATRGPGVLRTGVILLNAGSVPRVGPNRLHVPIARRLAAAGALVLRVDLTGLGDSPARPGAGDNVTYGTHALADVAAAVAWVRAQGVREVALVGLCSGAYHAFKAAVAGTSVSAVVAINPLTFFYEPGMPLDLAAFKVTEDAQRYGKQMKSLAAWKKLIAGRVNVRRVARVVAERARSVAEHRGREVLRRLRVPLTDDLGSELYALGRAGVSTRFVFAGEDPGHAMLIEQGGSAVERLGKQGKVAVEVIDGPDHTFTPRWSHALLEAAIRRAIGI